jgi:thioester reductase-like protein
VTDLVEHLERWAAAKPEATLYAYMDARGHIAESYTYGGFEARTAELAAHLAAKGIGYDIPVLLVFPPGLDFIAAFLACVRIGAVPVPIQPPDASGVAGGLEKLAYVMSDCGATMALTNEAYLAQLHKLVGRSPEATQCLAAPPLGRLAWLTIDTMRGPMEAARRRANPLLFLQYTSGSTQNPRGVMVSHDNVIANGYATLVHPDPVGVSWLPHYHDMGLIGYYLFILLRGGVSYWLPGTQFMRRPLQWLELISDVRATITSAPNFAYDYCLREDKVPSQALAALDLSSLVCVMNAAEPVRADTHRRFLAKFAPCGLDPRALVVYYGLAENTLCATGDGRVALTVNSTLLERSHLRIEAPRPDGYNQTEVMSCGRPIEGVVVRIVDPASRAVRGEDLIGEIWLAGASKAGGYFGKPELSRTLFAATVAGDTAEAPFFRTGDMGFLHDGELFVCGRLKDMIISNGRNFYPSDIEAVVERASPKIRAGYVAAFAVTRPEGGEGIAIVAEANRSNDLPDLEAIAIAIRKRCQVEVDLIAILPHGSIVKTSSGKVARQLCRSQWLEGTVTVLSERARAPHGAGNELLDDLLSRFDIEGYEGHTLAELGVDSITLVELSVYLEELLETRGDGADDALARSLFDLRILQAVTVGELRRLVQEIERTGSLPKAAPKTYLRRSLAIERAELAEMRGDAALSRDIAPRRPAVAPGAGKMLLTGATGFLGAHLLDALLRHSDQEVVVLVRAESPAHARARTESALQRAGLVGTEALLDRVEALPGDLAAPQLGLAAADWDRLSTEVTSLYHCGAEVDYVKPYHAMRGANVVGTAEMLRLACSGPAKHLNLISTTFMFGFVARQTCLEADCNAEMEGLNFGYPQTKWVAEQLVLEAARRGLPTTIYRPSLITASRAGHYVRGDFMARILSYMLRYGISTDTPNQLSLLPADVCAHNIVALSLLAEAKPQTFHITADDYYTMHDVCTLISRELGYRFRYLGLDQLIDHINAHCTRDDPLYPLVAFFNHNWRRIERMSHKRYDSSNYRRWRSRAPGAVAEPALVDTVLPIVQFLLREDMAPQAPRHAAPQALTLFDFEPSS